VLITTGLGGKGFKLRYFIVLFTPQAQELTKVQQKIINNELNYFLSKCKAEVEQLKFDDCFALITAMVPLRVHLKDLFRMVIAECNQLGDFLFNDFIITNVKELQTEEIKELLRVNNIY
jgi:hypothetical protein